MICKKFINYLKKPPKLDYMHKWLNKDSIKILDVGCGNHSPSITKKYYPNLFYYGLDKSRNYNLDEEDFKSMEKFYELDISKNNFDVIPNDYFDFLILSQVIEHVENGDDVVLSLIKKIKKNGVIYIEFPSKHTVHLPSVKGTLNFYDDPTHIKLYELEKLKLLLTNNNFTIIKSGIRHSLKKIILLPLYAISSFNRNKYIGASVFWDITGFASFIIASKN